MKTLMALLIATEGRPTLTHRELAKLRSKSHRTVQNEISAGLCPVPIWKDGNTWLCNVADVAAWLDRLRDEALAAAPRLEGDFERFSE
jgi:hypothetical protein